MRPLKIFICYRREDGGGHAGRLAADLRRHFGRRPSNYFRLEGDVVRDVDSIKIGDKWKEYISNVVGSCDVVITVIGRQWLSITDETGQRRLNDPDDTLVFELSTALSRDILVIPCLVQDAAMPKKVDLPKPLEELPSRNAIELNDSFWDEAVNRLVRRLKEVEPRDATDTALAPRFWVRTAILTAGVALATSIAALVLYLLFKRFDKFVGAVDRVFSIGWTYLFLLIVLGIGGLVLLELRARRLNRTQVENDPKAGSISLSPKPTRREVILGLTVYIGALFGLGAFGKILPSIRPGGAINGNTKIVPRFRKNKTPAKFATIGLKEGMYSLKRTPVQTKAAADAPVAVAVPSNSPEPKGSLTSKATPRGTADNTRPIIYFVDDLGRIPFVDGARFKDQQLKPAGPGDLTLRPQSAILFPERASAVCELAALSYLRLKQHDKAAEVLVAGIKQDLDAKGRKKSGVSFRLFDLLARIIARHGLNQYQSILLELAAQAEEIGANQKLGKPAERKRRKKPPAPGPPQAIGVQPQTLAIQATAQSADVMSEPLVSTRTRAGLFETRMKNWTNKDSKWWKKVTSNTYPLRWAITRPPDTSQGKESVYSVEI